MTYKTCEYCGKEFEASRPNQIYCSRDCCERKKHTRKVEKIRASCTTTKGKSLLDWCNENGERGSLLLSEYSSKNGKPAEKIAAGSNKKVYWKCSTCGYEWEAMVAKRTKLDQGCPSCSGAIKETNNLYLWCQEHGEYGKKLLEEYSTKNEKSLDEVAPKTKYKAKWVCSACGFEWEAQIQNRTRNYNGCPSCAGRVLETNNLYLWCMNNGERGQRLLSEYSYKNELLPEEITPMSGKKVYWKCSICGYEWEAVVSNRTSRGHDCPNCDKTQTSYGEQILYYILQRELKEHKVLNRAKVEGYEVDVFVTDLKFGIEYSGYRYHTDRVEQDEKKRNDLKDAGYNIIAILERYAIDDDLDCDFGFVRGNILNPDEMLHYLKSYMKENYNLDIDVSLSADEREVCKRNSAKQYIDIDEVVFVMLYKKTQNKCGEVLEVSRSLIGNKLKELSEKEYAEKVDNIVGIISISKFGDSAEKIASDFELDIDFVKKIQSYIKKYSVI